MKEHTSIPPDKLTRLLFVVARPLQRTIVSLVLALATAALTPLWQQDKLFIFMLVWIVFSLSYLAISWVILATRNIAHIRSYARRDDGSAVYVFIMVILSAFASMLIVLLLMLSDKAEQHQSLFLAVSIAGILLSWVMVHTFYTFHYAHMYYDTVSNNGKEEERQGLEFPGNNEPDYIDFAYFSFVIGCTFQVSDVEISSKKIRRSVLLHGILSFLLNTFVVALTINLIAGLRN